MNHAAQCDVLIVGAGLAGLATALRLQAAGLRTEVLEAHSRPGGCAGYYMRAGFSFDVGATTLVDFESGGVGGDFLDEIGLPPLEGDFLPGYRAWLPDRCVTVYRGAADWANERLLQLGDDAAHRRFWALVDSLSEAFWPASRAGVKLPMRSIADLLNNARALPLRHAPLARYMRWSMGDALRHFGIERSQALRGMLSMMVEDTVHAQLDTAPLINAALGINIRGAGLARARGGMHGFMRSLAARYVALGGRLRFRHGVSEVRREGAAYCVTANGRSFHTAQVVLAVPAQLAARLAPSLLSRPLRPYLERDAQAQGGGLVMFLGVPEAEVAGQDYTHHQLLQDYARPLGMGNNMFISVSAPGDLLSAPAGHRSVMVSTHCELADWEGLDAATHACRKQEAAELLLTYARRVYPQLGRAACVKEFGTPKTYAAFTQRPRGAVGGARLTLANSNQSAIPYDLGPKGLWMVGDTTWPGLGTVACVLASRHVARGARALHASARRINPVERLLAGSCRSARLPYPGL
ncbi:NAD(P)/FAD-dependent oxidoreductase [Viridibacterium curvum]|uniref:C-3',4' desaturase CrtD n=1 Tax=Viridibacterium curvum TaxID=1101404 RepID=A0ABP9QK41_9RHOO